jgi:hypothetical protein
MVKKGGVFMKRFLALVLVLISLTGTVYADTIDLSGYTDEELVALASAITAEQLARKEKTGGDYIVSGNINGCFVGLKETYVKNNILYFVLDFSHTSDEPESYGYSISITGYQDGIECGIAGGKKDTVTKVKKGVTIEVVETLQLRNNSSPVEIEIGKWLDLSGKGEKLYTVIPVK